MTDDRIMYFSQCADPIPQFKGALDRIEELERIVDLVKSLFSEDGAFEAVSHFNVASALKDELEKLNASAP